MDDLTRTQGLHPVGQLPLKKAFKVRGTESEFEARFARLFLGDLPTPKARKVSTFIYPSQQERSSKRQAPAPPKAKLREFGGINNYQLRTIKDLGPILTQSAITFSSTSCSADIIVNPLDSQRSPKLRTFCSDSKSDSDLKTTQNTPISILEGGTFRDFSRKNYIPSGDVMGDVSFSVLPSYKFPEFPESAFERLCVDSREQIGTKLQSSVLFYDYDDYGGPTEDKGHLTSKVMNAYFSLPSTGSPSVINESPMNKQISSMWKGSPSWEHIQPSYAANNQTLSLTSKLLINGTSHQHCISPHVAQISQHTQQIPLPDAQAMVDCIQGDSSCGTDIPLSMHSLQVSNLETDKNTLNKSVGPRFENEKLTQAENQLKTMENNCPNDRAKQTHPKIYEAVDDGDSEIVPSSPNLSVVLASCRGSHSERNSLEMYRYKKEKDSFQKKVPPPKPPRNRRGFFSKFCETEVPSLIEQDSNCKKVIFNNGDVPDHETPLKPPRHKGKAQSDLKKSLNNEGVAVKIAFANSKDSNFKQEQKVVENLPPNYQQEQKVVENLPPSYQHEQKVVENLPPNYQQEQKVVENLPPKRPERLHRKAVVSVEAQHRQSFRAKQQKTKKCRRKLSFPVKFGASLRFSLGIFKISKKHHTSKALGDRSCTNNSIPVKTWLYPKSSIPSDLEKFHIPRIIIPLEPSDVETDDSLEAIPFTRDEEHKNTSSSISSLVIANPLSYYKDDLSTLGSLQRIHCSQSSSLYENKEITFSQLSQHNEEHQEHTDIKNEALSTEKKCMLPSLVSDNVIFMTAFRYEGKDY